MSYLNKMGAHKTMGTTSINQDQHSFVLDSGSELNAVRGMSASQCIERKLAKVFINHILNSDFIK
jgi:hypothetical protein